MDKAQLKEEYKKLGIEYPKILSLKDTYPKTLTKTSLLKCQPRIQKWNFSLTTSGIKLGTSDLPLQTITDKSCYWTLKRTEKAPSLL